MSGGPAATSPATSPGSFRKVRSAASAVATPAHVTTITVAHLAGGLFMAAQSEVGVRTLPEISRRGYVKYCLSVPLLRRCFEPAHRREQESIASYSAWPSEKFSTRVSRARARGGRRAVPAKESARARATGL